jgi:predicted glycosyl hydrolase (DUF1957 family)
MSNYYAQINSNSICFAITQTSSLIDQPNMIAIDSYDISLLGKVWSDGQWIE